MNESDVVWLRHMLEAAQIGLMIAAETTRADLEHDVTRQLALSKVVELIGESAGKVSPDTRTALSNIEWRRMIGMHNVLAHDYFNMQLDILWDTIATDFPHLILEIANSLPPVDSAGSDTSNRS